jgi:hypothetical protein
MQTTTMPVASEPQAHRLAAKLPPLAPEQADKPRVLIEGSLILTREQEDRLLAHVQQRKSKLAGDLGLRDFSSQDWYRQGLTNSGRHERKHLDTQYMALLTYAMKFDWRPSILGGIFAESNLHVPVTRRILQQQIARLIAYFTGTDPYYSAYDVGSEDKALSEKLDRWIRHTLDSDNNTRADIDAGLERAAITSGAFFALSYQKKYSYYQRKASVLIGADGAPYVSTVDGDFILEKEDSFIAKPATGAPGTPTGEMVLKRDGITPYPGQDLYEEQIIWRRTLVKEGPKADLLQPADFLYPLDAATLDEADILWHRTSEPLINLVHRFGQVDGLGPEDTMQRVALMLERLLPGSNRNPDAAAKQGRADLSEGMASLGTDDQEPQLNIGRFCLHYDANEDGNMEDILLIATEEGYPIAYDYVANFTPDARRPYRCLRINPVAGRIHGQGNVEVFESLQTDADLVFNRWNFSQSSSGRVTLWRPHNTVEGDADPALKLNNGGTYTPKPGKTDAEILSYVALPDLKGMDLKTMLEFIMQIALNMSGVTNVNDAGMVGMDTAKLATGVRNLEASGSELFGKFISDLMPDVRDLVRSLGQLAIAHLDSPRVFKFFNGDVSLFAEITPEEVRDMSLNVDLEMTKYRGQQEAAQAQSAAVAAQQFYMLPPLVQQRLTSLYRQQLKSYQIKDAEEIIVPFSAEEIAASMPPAPEAPAGPAASAAQEQPSLPL